MQVQEDPPGQEDPLEEETLQHSCLKNPMDRGAWQATVHRVAKESDTTERLSTWPNQGTVSEKQCCMWRGQPGPKRGVLG